MKKASLRTTKKHRVVRFQVSTRRPPSAPSRASTRSYRKQTDNKSSRRVTFNGISRDSSCFYGRPYLSVCVCDVQIKIEGKLLASGYESSRSDGKHVGTRLVVYAYFGAGRCPFPPTSHLTRNSLTVTIYLISDAATGRTFPELVRLPKCQTHGQVAVLLLQFSFLTKDKKVARYQIWRTRRTLQLCHLAMAIYE